MIDPYRVLSVRSGVSATELKQAWLRKARQVHPDTGGGPAKFKEVTAAYEMLCRQMANSSRSPAGRPVEQHENCRRRARTRRGTGQTSDAGSVASGRGVYAADPGFTNVRPSSPDPDEDHRFRAETPERIEQSPEARPVGH